MGVPDIQQAAKATDNFGLLKSSLEQCEHLEVPQNESFIASSSSVILNNRVYADMEFPRSIFFFSGEK